MNFSSASVKIQYYHLFCRGPIFNKGKIFNKDVLVILMKEVIKENRSDVDSGIDECCSIAESMIEEIHQIAVQECYIVPFAVGRHKGSLKKRLLRQIRQARMAAVM
jgi:hypothetical protein